MSMTSQLLAVTFPAVLFHFYSNYISGEVEKLKMEEEELKKTQEKTEKDDRSDDVLKSVSSYDVINRTPYFFSLQLYRSVVGKGG